MLKLVAVASCFFICFLSFFLLFSEDMGNDDTIVSMVTSRGGAMVRARETEAGKVFTCTDGESSSNKFSLEALDLTVLPRTS